MKILQYFEKAWIVASIVSVVVAIYNLVSLQQITNRVYFPFFCSMFCLLIWMNIRGQRRFRDKMLNEEQKNRKPEGL